MEGSGVVKFDLNGETVEFPAEQAATMTLNEFIRNHTRFTGTKLSCGQGGCGACTVAISRFDASNNEVSTITSNSCLLPLVAVHNTAVTTAEGLAGNNTQSLGHNKNPLAHPIQDRVVQMYASQCGFCTPGMVMQMWGGIQQHCHKPGSDGETTMCTQDEIEDLDLLVANLCRCTGYRPLQDTLKSFARDSDVKDHVGNKPLAPYTSDFDPYFVNQLRSRSIAPSSLREESSHWKRPRSLDELKSALAGAANPRVVCGHTAWGVYPDLCSLTGSGDLSKHTTVQIDCVPELTSVSVSEAPFSVTIGAGLPIASFAQELANIASGISNADDVVTPLRDHLLLIAGHQIRNRGSVGGNLMLVRQFGFASDIAPLLIALGATVDHMEGSTTKTGTLLVDFLAAGSAQGVVLLSIHVPLGERNEHGKQILRTHRASFRPRNAYALSNGAFWASLDGGKITDSRFVYGAMGSVPRIAQGTKELVKGQQPSAEDAWSKDLMQKVLAIVESEIGDLARQDQAEGDHHLVYRIRQAQTFTMRFMNALAANAANPTAAVNPADPVTGTLHARRTRRTHTEQTLPANTAEIAKLSPAFESYPKTTTLAQATGDAKFTDDETLAHADGMVSAAYLTIPGAGMVFTELQDDEAKAQLGKDYVGFLSAKDLQAQGLALKMEVSKFPFLTSPNDPPRELLDEFIFLPANTPSEFDGQPIAVVLGKTQRIAERAAKLIKIVGLARDSATTVTTGPEGATSIIRPSVFHRGDRAKTQQIFDDVAAGRGKSSYEIVSSTFNKASQVHFYIEPQTAFAIPEEEGCMTLYTACQGLDSTQQFLANQLKLRFNQLNLKFRRVGGAFGGKASRSIPIAIAVALACKKFRKPVRLVLPRRVDTSMTGGRQELQGTWDAVVDRNANGRVVALKMDLKMCQGAYADMSAIHVQMVGQTIDMCYKIDNALVTIDLVRTNTAPRTSVRGPGHFEASSAIETVMDGIAGKLGLGPEVVKLANIHTGGGMLPSSGLSGGLLPPSMLHGNSMPALWQRLMQRSNFNQRRDEIAEFNKKPENKFRRRGLGIAPAKYGIVRTPGFAVRVDVFEDGSVQIACAGCEMGQGFHTKIAQVCCATFGQHLKVKPALDDIRFTNFSSEVIMYGKTAGGSTASEMACFAVEDACTKLSGSFKEFLKTLAKAKKEACKLKKSSVDPARKSNGDANGDANGDDANNDDDVIITSEDTVEEESSWRSLIKAAKKGPPKAPMWAMHFSEFGMYMPPIDEIVYETYGAAVTEVEVDTLTGETKVLSSHVMFDSGPSMNPGIDLGQVEGAFIMGLGAMLLEGTQYDKDGNILTTNTWDYKIPTAFDIPNNFVVDLVDLRKESKDGAWGVVLGTASGALGAIGKPWKPTKGNKAFRSSKGTGEPPLLFSSSVLSAVKQAIATVGVDPLIGVPIPATPEVISGLCWGAQETSLNARLAKN